MIWKPITGFIDRYMVCNTGMVKSIPSNKIMSIQVNKDGYSHVNLWDGKKYKTGYIHRLVAIEFIPNPESKPEVNHIDFNPRNNHYKNLEWSTGSENRIHSSNYNRLSGSMKPKVSVKCISKSGALIKTFNSISAAEREMKITQQNISKVLSGERKFAGGFAWEVAI